MEPTHAADGQERVEQLLRDAHLHRMRQQWAAAEALCREALELAPEDGTALEMLGDLVSARGNVDESLELYRRALEKLPGKAVLEEKLARLVLRKAEEEHERATALLMLESPRQKGEQKRTALIGMLLSLVCPGAGQYFFGQRVKGVLLFFAGAVPLALGLNDLCKLGLGLGGLLPRNAPPPNDILAWIGLVGVAVWVYSLLDAAAQAGRSKKTA